MFRGRAANAAHGSSGQKNHLNDSEADADYASDDSDQNPAVASFRSVASVEIGNSLHSSIHNSLHSPVNEPGTQHSSPRSRRPDFDNSTHTTDSSEDAAALTIEGEDAAVERGGIAVRRGSATSIDPIPLLKGDPSSHSSCGAPPPSEDATLLPTASTSGHGDNTTHGLFVSVRAAPVPLKDSRADEEYDLPVNVHAAPTPAAAAAVATQSIASDGAATIGNADLKSPADGQKCALKLVAKEIFWSRAAEGKERTDSLVREALAQLLLCCHFAGNYVLTFVNEDVFTYADTEATSTVVNDKDTSCGGSRHVAQAQRLQQTRSDPYLPIVQLFSVFETVNGLALELELMQSKDLFDRLAEEGPFSEQQVKQIVYQLIEAVSLCNRLGIAHRDIKLSNITFPFPPTDAEALPPTLEEQDFITVKLADFGMTGFVGADRQLRGRCGTPGYVAPDILLAERNQSYDLNVDIFSVWKKRLYSFIHYRCFYVFNIIHIACCCCRSASLRTLSSADTNHSTVKTAPSCCVRISSSTTLSIRRSGTNSRRRQKTSSVGRCNRTPRSAFTRRRRRSMRGSRGR